MQRDPKQDTIQFIQAWDDAYAKVRNGGDTLTERCLAYLLVHSCQLDDVDHRLVMSEMDFHSEKGKKSLISQAKKAIRKNASNRSMKKKKTNPDLTLITKALEEDQESDITAKIEKVLVSKGWTKPKYERKKRQSQSFISAIILTNIKQAGVEQGRMF